LQEKIADVAGAMVTGNTETGIAVSYDDADNTLDFVVTETDPEWISDSANYMRNAGDTTTGSYVFADAYHVSSASADSHYVTANTVGDSVETALRLEDTAAFALTILESPTVTTAITVPNNSISDEELDEDANFTWTGTHDFSGADYLKLPMADYPPLDAEGYFAWDQNDDALSFYSGTEAEIVNIPIYQHISIPLVVPDSLAVYAPNLFVFYCNPLMYPHGIRIDAVSLMTPAASTHSIVLEEWTNASPPAWDADIKTVTLATTTFGDSTSVPAGAVASGNWLVLDLVAAQEDDHAVVNIIFHVLGGD